MIKRILDAPASAGERMTWSSEDSDHDAQPAAKPVAVKKRAREAPTARELPTGWREVHLAELSLSYNAAVAKAETEAALAAIANGPQKISLEE